MDRFVTKIDDLLDLAQRKIHLHVFEADKKVEKENLLFFPGGEIKLKSFFTSETIIFACLNWLSNSEMKQDKAGVNFNLEVAIDVSKSDGKMYFDNLVRMLSTSTTGSRFIVNLGFSIPKEFLSTDGKVKDLSKTDFYPCKEFTVMTNKFG